MCNVYERFICVNDCVRAYMHVRFICMNKNLTLTQPQLITKHRISRFWEGPLKK